MVLFNLANISQIRLSRKIPLRNKLASQWSSNHFPIPTPWIHRCILITVCAINVIELFHIPEPSTLSHMTFRHYKRTAAEEKWCADPVWLETIQTFSTEEPEVRHNRAI